MNIVINIRRMVVLAVGGVTLVGLAACGSSGAAATSGGGTRVSVVASTDVYGDLVTQVAGAQAGKAVRITSIIDDPAADPHSYEANARVQLAISRADVIVENGGGYDDFVDQMRRSAGSHPTVLNAVAISGKAQGADLNEHVWYDMPTVRRVVARIAAALAAADSTDATQFRSNAAALDRQIASIQAREAAVRADHAGAAVSITEPVPLYLLTACGLVNRTPEQFSHAIEEGSDVPAATLRSTLQLYTRRQVRLLAYNEQTSSPETIRVLATARAHGVAVVPVTETLPQGTTFATWMTANIAAVSRALA